MPERALIQVKVLASEMLYFESLSNHGFIAISLLMMREFSELSAKEVFALAISIEEHNRDRYREWSKRFCAYDQGASTILDELAEEEESHRQYLIKHYLELFGENIIRIDPTEVEEDLELQKLPNEHFFVIDNSMAKSILETALHNEEVAMKFYINVLASTHDPKLRAVYKPLAEFEADHVRLLEEKLELL